MSRHHRHEQDLQLLRGLLNGDREQFDRFFDDHFPPLYRYVLTRVGGDRDAARTLCEQTLIQGLEHAAQYRGDAGLFNWLCQIASDHIAMWWTHRKTDAVQALLVEDDIEVARLVQVALDQLPAQYGRALEWQFLDGLSVAEVATRLGQPCVAAQSLLTQASAAFCDVFAVLATAEMTGWLAGDSASDETKL
ncbi:MAG: RNA polymerase sigma factor [Pseudomonadota bacterium]